MEPTGEGSIDFQSDQSVFIILAQAIIYILVCCIHVFNGPGVSFSS